MIPKVKDCTAEFGIAKTEFFGAKIPIRGVAGDRQAAMLGQACLKPGISKATYGTDCFMLLNTGENLVASQNRMLGTIASKLNGRVTYALEGSIFNAGSVLNWLQNMGIIENYAEAQALAEGADLNHSVVLVPAFAGLGAPYWDTDCRGAMYWMTRDTGPADFVRAALESVSFQSKDLWDAMHRDWSADEPTKLRVDGGTSVNDWFMQNLSYKTGVSFDRVMVTEATALRAAWLAGYQSEIHPEAEVFAEDWQRAILFEPNEELGPVIRTERYDRWKDDVLRTLSNS